MNQNDFESLSVKSIDELQEVFQQKEAELSKKDFQQFVDDFWKDVAIYLSNFKKRI